MQRSQRRFLPGETIVRREIMRGEPWIAVPQICVLDEPDLLVTYTPPGARFAFPAEGEFPAGRSPWEVDGKTEWTGHGMLALHFPGVDHSVNAFWTGPERRFARWYFNLQDALRRTEIGFDTLDHELDLVWDAGAPTWQWKDEEAFASTGELRYPGRTAEIRAEGERIAKLLDAGERWWDESWASWVPDDSYGVPLVPSNWTEIPFTAR
ncbi:MAG TPA: DUF402 domain-containing protein [Candidatus Limnocylindrales bacterium]